jgi:hypothetical protein
MLGGNAAAAAAAGVARLPTHVETGRREDRSRRVVVVARRRLRQGRSRRRVQIIQTETTYQRSLDIERGITRRGARRQEDAADCAQRLRRRYAQLGQLSCGARPYRCDR